MAESIDQILDRAAELLAADRKVALCLLVKATGSTPVPAGAVLLVDDTAVTYGTIGGGCVEAELRRQVVAMLCSGRTGVLHFDLDHDHGWDDAMICGGSIDLAVAEQPARYIGMIGSRRKVQVVMDDLRAAGISKEALGRVRAPIGLGIGAVTADEIALSIAAQLVEVRRDGYRSPVRGPLSIDAVSA
ncbi:MAG: XdhC family protein [Phycisphaerales bacterium]